MQGQIYVPAANWILVSLTDDAHIPDDQDVPPVSSLGYCYHCYCSHIQKSGEHGKCIWVRLCFTLNMGREGTNDLS